MLYSEVTLNHWFIADTDICHYLWISLILIEHFFFRSIFPKISIRNCKFTILGNPEKKIEKLINRNCSNYEKKYILLIKQSYLFTSCACTAVSCISSTQWWNNSIVVSMNEQKKKNLKYLMLKGPKGVPQIRHRDCHTPHSTLHTHTLNFFCPHSHSRSKPVTSPCHNECTPGDVVTEMGAAESRLDSSPVSDSMSDWILHVPFSEWHFNPFGLR